MPLLNILIHLSKFLTAASLLLLLWPAIALSSDIPPNEQQRLHSILIRLNQPDQLEKLQKYPVEIIKIRTDKSSDTHHTSLNTPQIIEAVTTNPVIERLIKDGFSVRKVSRPRKKPEQEQSPE